MKLRSRRAIFLIFVLILTASAGAQTTGSSEPGGPATHDGKSMAQVNKQLNNPVGDLWALNFQFNRYYLQGEATDRTREQDLLNFQPVLPLHLTSEWSLINRPVFPFIFSSPDFEPGEGWDDLVKIGPPPVKFIAEADYVAIHPNDFGQHWGVRFQIIPVLPALFKDTLL